MAEIPYTEDFEQQLMNKGKIIGMEFANGGHPINGCAYWRFAAVKFNHQLYILEWSPDNDETKCKITKIDY